MSKKITELLKTTSYTYPREYGRFINDKWGSWTNSGVFNNSLVAEGWIRSICQGTTAAPSLPKPNSSRVIKGLRKAKSIRANLFFYQSITKGWYVREQPDAYLQMLNGYIMMRYGGNGSYISVGGHHFLNTANNSRFDTTFYQKYMICNGTRYDYPDGIKLSYADGDLMCGYSYAGFITSNDYFECMSDLFLDDFLVELRT